MEILTQLAIDLPMSALEEFCQRWQIQELAVFGSVLRDDFSSSGVSQTMTALSEPSGSY